jgi:hypothetical protein
LTFFALKRSERDFDFGLFLKNDFSSRWTQQRLSGERERQGEGGGKVRERRTPSLSHTHTHTHTCSQVHILEQKCRTDGQTDRQTDEIQQALRKEGQKMGETERNKKHKRKK